MKFFLLYIEDKNSDCLKAEYGYNCKDFSIYLNKFQGI